MSGGHFDYNQNRIQYIADDIEEILESNKYEFSDKTLKRFEEAVSILRLAYIYAQRIDWLISADDGEDSFHERLEDECSKTLIKPLPDFLKSVE